MLTIPALYFESAVYCLFYACFLKKDNFSIFLSSNINSIKILSCQLLHLPNSIHPTLPQAVQVIRRYRFRSVIQFHFHSIRSVNTLHAHSSKYVTTSILHYSGPRRISPVTNSNPPFAIRSNPVQSNPIHPKPPYHPQYTAPPPLSS